MTSVPAGVGRPQRAGGHDGFAEPWAPHFDETTGDAGTVLISSARPTSPMATVPRGRARSETELANDREVTTSPIRVAGRSTTTAAVVLTLTASASVIVPQAWHSSPRPTHLKPDQPHSEQR
jgi:hypothetical protein